MKCFFLNLWQQCDSVCGYSYDYNASNKNEHCMVHVQGVLNKKSNAFHLLPYYFISVSGNHVMVEFYIPNKTEKQKKKH